MKNLLVVDDDKSILTFLALVLNGEGRNIVRCDSPAEALEHLAHEPFDLLISDYMMPGMDGLQLLAEARRLQPHCVRILISGKGAAEIGEAGIDAVGVYRFISKPLDVEPFLDAVDEALRQ